MTGIGPVAVRQPRVRGRDRRRRPRDPSSAHYITQPFWRIRNFPRSDRWSIGWNTTATPLSLSETQSD
jgi:hypothetical protein